MFVNSLTDMAEPVFCNFIKNVSVLFRTDTLRPPAVVQVTWTLRDKNKDVVDYEHFSVPYILTVDEILAKIHNLTLREMPGAHCSPTR